MFRKLNIYTVLTFVVYPVFFMVILILLFLTTCSGTAGKLSEKQGLKEKEIVESSLNDDFIQNL